MQTTIQSHSSQETEAIAAKIGANLRGGETIELISDVGGGKTTFTRGLARGAGSDDHVSSPTFTISNTYTASRVKQPQGVKGPSFHIYHFDFYRLPEAGIIEHHLHETVDAEHDVTIVEWADTVQHVLPPDRLTIRITADGDDQRTFALEYPKSLEYLVEDLVSC